jgi:hypothetical protein
MDYLAFGAAVAPIEELVQWQGATWTVGFAIVGTREDVSVLTEAARGDPAVRDYLETAYRLAQCVYSVNGEVVALTHAERLRWVLGDPADPDHWPGWRGPFLWEVARAYTRAEERVVVELATAIADPPSPAPEPAPSGRDSGQPATSPIDPLPPTSAATSLASWTWTPASGGESAERTS